MALLRWAFLCTQWTAMRSCCSEEAFLVNVSGDIYVRALAANWPLFKRFHFILLCRREFCHSPHIQAYIELTVNGNRRLGRSLGVTWHLWLTREEKVIEEHFNKHLVSARVASTTCRICEACGTKRKTLSSHEESNLRPSDSAFPCSITEPQGPFGERG